MPASRRPFLAVALLLGPVLLGACGDDGEAGAACGPVVREALDPNAGHVLPTGQAEPTYRTEPPTSGAHTPGPAPIGVVDEPLSRPAQVGALEAGAVLVQYRDPADLEALRPLAAGPVAVVPNPDLADRVVLTAWLFKQTCSAVDADAIAAFGTEHGGQGPGTDA